MAMAAEDEVVRSELAAAGSLFQGYHPRMAEVHRRNAAALAAIIAGLGWPVPALVGDDGSRAAWLVLQHAIGDPPFQRRGLEMLRAAVGRGEVPGWQASYLEDRIRFFEGRPQVYGTQYDWDEYGRISPLPVEDPAGVDERRKAVGLLPLEEDTRRKREGIARSGEGPPRDWAKRQRDMEAWARSVGWRE
jgi:hypothetical protein